MAKTNSKNPLYQVSLSGSGSYDPLYEQKIVSFGSGLAELLGVAPNIEYFGEEEVTSESPDDMRKRLLAEVEALNEKVREKKKATE